MDAKLLETLIKQFETYKNEVDNINNLEETKEHILDGMIKPNMSIDEIIV